MTSFPDGSLQRPLRLGTGAGELAAARARRVAARLSARGREVECVADGDASRGLLAGALDLAVVALDEVGPDETDGIVIGAILARTDARDAVVGGRIAELAPGAVLHVGSRRQRAQILALRADLRTTDDAGAGAPAVTSVAALELTGRLDAVAEFLAESVVVPAPGQGLLAVQCRYEDGRARGVLAPLHDFAAAACAVAERAVVRELRHADGALGAHARFAGGGLEVLGFLDGRLATVRGDVEDAEDLGRMLARRLRPA